MSPNLLGGLIGVNPVKPYFKGTFIRLLIDKGTFTEEEFLDMVKGVNYEMKKERKGN